MTSMRDGRLPRAAWPRCETSPVTVAWLQRIILSVLGDYELVAQELSGLSESVGGLESHRRPLEPFGRRREGEGKA